MLPLNNLAKSPNKRLPKLHSPNSTPQQARRRVKVEQSAASPLRRKTDLQHELRRRIMEIEVEGRGNVKVVEYPDGIFKELAANGRITNTGV